MSAEGQTTNHADESMKVEGGGANVRLHLVGTDKPLMTAVSLCLAAGALLYAFINHQSDQDRIRDFSRFAAQTYNREVAIDADLNIMGIDAKKRYGAIPLPPEIDKRKD